MPYDVWITQRENTRYRVESEGKGVEDLPSILGPLLDWALVGDVCRRDWRRGVSCLGQSPGR
jgi:hypothetical protein